MIYKFRDEDSDIDYRKAAKQREIGRLMSRNVKQQTQQTLLRSERVKDEY